MYSKHDYDVPNVYNILSNFVSYLLRSIILETNSPIASWFEMSNTLANIDIGRICVWKQ